MSTPKRPSWPVRAVQLAEQMFGPVHANKVFEPLVADWQRELATADGRIRRAESVVRGSLALLTTAAHSTRVALVSRELLPALGVGMLFAVLGTALLALPFALVNFARLSPALWPLMLPSLAAIAVPVAVLPAALRIGASVGDDVAQARLRTAALAVILVPLLLGVLGWAVPTANQAWRLEVAAMARRPAPSPAVRGLRELRLHELASAKAVAAYGHAARSELRKRVLIPLLWPPLLAMLGWHVGRHRRRAGALALTGYWLVPALTLTVVAYAPNAGFVFEAPDLVCAGVWTGMIAVLRLARRRDLTPLTSAD